MPKPFGAPSYQSTLIVLAGTIVGVAIIAGLNWAQPVLIPIALAIFLSIPLTPVVEFLEKLRLGTLRLGRTLSVVVVVVLVSLFLGGTVWLVNSQVSNLANDLPRYSENIQSKVKKLREMGDGGAMDRLRKMTEDIIGEWKGDVEEEAPGATGAGATAAVSPVDAGSPESPAPTVVQSAGPTWLVRLTTFLFPIVTSLGYLALALVLVVFILLERESLRNRLIRIVGRGRMTTTTRALEDAGARITSYLTMQLVVNSGCGLVWGVAVHLVGVKYALLWGFLAAVLRYVPYIGAPLASLFPIALSFAQLPGWWAPITLITILVVMELVCNNVIEPWLYGRRIGVSEVAMVISAAFWTFLWGPFGLVMSAPMTVCLVVLGKHVPELNFFAVMLSDAPALEKDLAFYQRLLARDQDEAVDLALTLAKDSSPEQVYDELLIPGLIYAKRDRERDVLTDADELFVHDATLEILEDLGEHRAAAKVSAAKVSAAKDEAAKDADAKDADGKDAADAAIQAPLHRVRLLACPARDESDRVALEMLRQLLNPAEWDVEVAAVETLTAELVAHAAEEGTEVLCIGALPPGGLSHTRYLCKRLREQNSAIKILVGRWGLKDSLDANRERLQEAGADLTATTMLETRDQLNNWLPELAHQKSKSATAAPVVSTAPAA